MLGTMTPIVVDETGYVRGRQQQAEEEEEKKRKERERGMNEMLNLRFSESTSSNFPIGNSSYELGIIPAYII